MNIPFALEPIMPQINYEQVGLDLYFEGILYSQAVANQNFTMQNGLCTLDRHWLKQQLHMDARKVGINYAEKRT